MIYYFIVLIIVLNWLPTLGEPEVIVSPLIMRVFPKDIKGFTLGKFIVIKDNNPSDELIRHELVHVGQYKKWGVIVFLACYYSQMLYYFIKLGDINKAYRAISFEREAYEE